MLRPDVIYFHSNIEPTGDYWDQAKKIENFTVNKRQPPTFVFGQGIQEPQSETGHSNVDRVKVLLEYGGIYLDLDVLVTKSMDKLREHKCTVGYEYYNGRHVVCGGIIVCSKDSAFLHMWAQSFLEDYRPSDWAYNSGQVILK